MTGQESDGGSQERAVMRSPVDIESFTFEDDDGTEIVCVRATMIREREKGPVEIVEEVVVKDGEPVQHRRTCESPTGDTIERVETF